MSKRNLTTSILGDAGAAEATVVPNLESLNTGSDAYVTSISDTSEFNVFQQLKIYDNYWDTLFARHIINAANAGASPDLLSQVNIQGNTEGWARADHLCLMVPITFTYVWLYVRRKTGEIVKATTPLASDNDADAFLVGGTAFPWDTFHTIVNNAALIFNPEWLKNYKHAWFGCLDGFERLRILVGNNGQMLQKQIETEPIGMKHHMSTARVGEIMAKVIGEWGVPNPSGFEMTDTPKSVADSISSGTTDWGTNLEEARKMFDDHTASLWELDKNQNGLFLEDEVKHYFKMLGTVSSVSNYDSRSLVTQAGTTNRWCITTRKRNLTLPLQAIHPFFRGAKFLPPDFRFKFEIEVNSGRVIAKKNPLTVVNVAAQVSTGMTPNGTYGYIKSVINANGIELHYPYHILRQPVQAAISAMWLQKPFLFNYETIQTTEIIPSQGATFINFTISISTQRPTILDAYLFPINSMATWESDYTITNHYSDTAGTSVPTGYRIKNTPHNHGDVTGLTNVNKNSADAGPCIWRDLEIMLSGRTAYRFLNSYNTFHGVGADSTQPNELFVQLFEEQSMRSTATEFNATSHAERNTFGEYMTNSNRSFRMLRLIIQPGGWTDRGVISSRQGATTITLNMNLTKGLSASDRFVVFRTNPEQLVFDSDKNVTIIQWPAIKSNMGYLIPNITAAP